VTAGTAEQQAAGAVTFREVFAVSEWRAVWLAQLVSFGGDQFARVAVAVLVYGRTGSPLLAAVTFALTTLAMFAGGLLLGWTADHWPRRQVMIVADLACAALVAVMLIPGLPLAALIALLFTVGLAIEPFLSARMATNVAVLGERRFQVGNGITLATYQVAQLAGFAAGGAVVAALGVRAAIAVDAASFLASAALIRFGLRARPAPGGGGPARPQVLAGVRVVFTRPVAVAAMGLLCLTGFYGVPEGLSVPLSRQLGGGAGTVGVLLAAGAVGATIGPMVYTRFVGEDLRMRLAAVTALAGVVVLTAFAGPPVLAGAVVILAVSGLFTGFIPAAAGAMIMAVPDEHRGKANGVVGAAMSLAQAVAVLAAGAIAQRVSPALVIAWFAVGGSAAGAVLALAWRRARAGEAAGA
jgi:predicted MFS family arabinose efflux permease